MKLTNDSGLQIYKNSPGDVLSSSSLTEEGVEGIVSSSESLVTGHLSVRLDPMFQAVKLPACIANLDTSLTDVDGDTLTLWKEKETQRLIPVRIFNSCSFTFQHCWKSTTISASNASQKREQSVAPPI